MKNIEKMLSKNKNSNYFIEKCNFLLYNICEKNYTVIKNDSKGE